MLLRLWLLVLLVCVSAFAPSRAEARAAENRTWVFLPQTVETRLESEPQAAGTHQENGLWNYEHAPGYSQAAKSGPTQLEFDFVKTLPEKPPIQWPPNRGVDGVSSRATLIPGSKIDRFGYDGGTFVSPQGTPYIERALAPGTQYKPYNVFEVVKPIEVDAGRIAPWFDMPGGGMQYELPGPVTDLLGSGHLRRL